MRHQHEDKVISEAHFGEDNHEEVDKEWEEFAMLLEKKKNRQEQPFYPCPPQEEDYINTLVSVKEYRKE